ncbi:MAG: hypothetical protein CVU05_00390 [Bacteroidetes bacterium HGW-Bacteroidetes-21]|jgi:TM2 domain-containing membrane protein YozV|nr:MAG: hypothetical protein CVU05_00390 [Bacteroidetes bacterium HGW-Bacteroidetes-21]
MKTLKFTFLMTLISVFIFTSCSIERRKYMPGFHVENKTKTANEKPSTAQQTNVAIKTNDKQQITEENTTTAVVKNDQLQASTSSKDNPLVSKKTTSTNVNSTSEIQIAKEKKTIKHSLRNSELNKDISYGVASPSSPAGEYTQIIALALCFFLGYLGIHSFFLGNTKKGIWQLVMFLVGIITSIILIGFVILIILEIWVLIDFIRLIVGDLGPGW